MQQCIVRVISFFRPRDWTIYLLQTIPISEFVTKLFILRQL